MKKKLFPVFIFLLHTGFLMATDGEYAVSKIPKQLFKNANAVLRLEEIKFEIKSTGHTVLTNHYVITILNENGDNWAGFYEYYNKFREVESVEGTLYDENGKQLKRVKKKDLDDISAVDEGSLIDDSRYKRHNFYYRVYPYTVEYTSVVSNKSTLFFPSWTPQGGEKISVEKSSMSIICSPDYQFRYKAFLYNKAPVVTEEKNAKISTWSISDLPAIVRESFSPLWHELTITVIFGPTDFEVDDYKGNMKSWQDFGKFVHTLKQGRDILPVAVKQSVHQIADGIKDPFEKIRKLYQYMQKNTRYISIQLGIGGWQPFDATFVATKAYGDCKALTNYMYSLLKEAGIRSCYTLIRAGKYANYITEDFPSQQFNHVILCVPLVKDTVWLECTSQTLPAGYLGDFTCDRPALLVDEMGGTLVRTPKYELNENRQSRNISALLDEEGTLNIIANSNYTGLQQDDIHGLLNYLSKDKMKEYLHQQLDFATYTINLFKYKEEKSRLPVVNEMLDITVSNYAAISGKRLFIVPNLMTRENLRLSADSTRKYDIRFGYSYKDIDTVIINLPAGYMQESIPKDVEINSTFGTYKCSVKLLENKLIYYRTMESYGGRFPVNDYEELVNFYNAVYKADRNKVVLVKNE